MSTSTSTTSSTIIDTTFRLSPPPPPPSQSQDVSDSDSHSHSSRERERQREIRRQKKKKRERGKSKEKEKDRDRDREERKEQEQDRLVDIRKHSRERISSRTSTTGIGETYGSYQVDDLDVDELCVEPTILEHVPTLIQPSHTISIPTEIESPTTRIEREADETRVQIWLEENGFNAAIRHQLHGYNGSDILQLSKNDCKDLIGVKDGIRLYNRLKWTKQAELEPHQQFGGIQPVKRSPYGLCDELGCQRNATSLCDGTECGRALCTTHSTKYLLTSSIFCRSCYQVSSLSKVVHVVAQNEQCIIN